MASKLDSIRRVRLETRCCRTKTRFEIGVEGVFNGDGFPYCGGCNRWCPELQVVREVADCAPPPASGPRQARVIPDRSYVEVHPKSPAVAAAFGAAPRVRRASMRRTVGSGGSS